MLGKIWRIGFKELTLAGAELPQGVEIDKSWRMPRGSSTIFASPEMRRDVLDMYKVLGGALPPMADFKRPDIVNLVINRINKALDRGDIIALIRRAPSAVGSQGQPGSSGSTPGSSGGSKSGLSGSGSGGSSDPTSEKTWVDIQLVDEEGEPISGERYILKLTDGSVREGSLDASGRVRVNGIDPGNCTVIFPDLHANEWKRKS